MDLSLPISADRVGDFLNAKVLGDPGRVIERLSSVSDAGAGSLSFVAGSKYKQNMMSVRDAVLLVREEEVEESLPLTYVVVPDPKRAFAQLASRLYQKSKLKGVSPLAQISPEAQIAEDVYVGPYAVIEAGARIGSGTSIYPFAYIGPNVVIGEGCGIYPHVVILDRVTIGNRVKIYPGAVLGSDGFGLITEAAATGSLLEIPQIGTVVVEDDVRIGAKCTIDRATLGETRIARGAKLDDQVHVGHNTIVGPNSILCAQVGLSGSVTLGQGVVLGGQAGIAPQVKVGDKARLGGQSGTARDLESGKDYFLSPAFPLGQALKMTSVFARLPELEKRVKDLEKKLGEGEGK